MPDIGVSFCVDHMIAMLSTGRMKYGSRAVRSWIHSVHGAWRSSTDSISTQYSAMKMIICGSTGRQPPTGLIFSVRSEERRVGKEGDRQCNIRRVPSHKK